MKKFVNILYTICMPVTPLSLHLAINFFSKASMSLEYVYPELFFATISICVELMRILDIKDINSDLKNLISLLLRFILIFSSFLYGSIIFANNIENSTLNIMGITIASIIVFSGSIILCIGIISQGDH